MSKVPFEEEHKVLNEAMSLRESVGTILPLEAVLLAKVVVELRAIRATLERAGRASFRSN